MPSQPASSTAPQAEPNLGVDRRRPECSPLHRGLSEVPWGPIALLCAAAALVAFGICGVGREDPINGDMRFLFAAGKAWLSGKNPYALGELIAATPPSLGPDFAALGFGFAYPPQAAPLSLLLGALEFPAASALTVVLNATAAGLLALACARLAQVRPPGAPAGHPAAVASWFVPALVLGNPFSHHVMFMGQTSLVAAALLVWGWYLAYRERPVPTLAGILLGASTLKPQLAFLPLVLLLLDGRLRVLAIAAATSALMAAPALAICGPVTTARTWLEAMALYQNSAFNVVSSPHVFGLRSLVAPASGHVPSLIPLALAAALALRLGARRFSHGDRLGLLTAASCLFLYAHDYDLVAILPLTAALWVRTSRSAAMGAAYLACLAALSFPQRLLRGRVPDAALHYRELVVLALATWLLVEVWRPRAPRVADGVA